jgi:spore maturation protein CgeB
MKFLVAGDWHSNVHEQPVYNALEALGYQVDRFAWHDYFRVGQNQNGLVWLWRKFENKYLVGPSFVALNRALVDVVQRSRPDVLFVYRGTHITANTLREIRRISPATLLVGYNNDDPFSPRQPRWAWRHFFDALPEYDLMLAYRQHNLDDFLRSGARRVELLRSWFVPENNHPVTLSPEDRAQFECDVVFVGHNEPDGRLELLEEIARQGFRLRLFGPYKGFGENGWYPAIDNSPLLRHLAPVSLVWGEEYNKALCGAKMALCFLSKRNRDTYTRRCFEIPATRTMLFSEYTDDLATLYEEGRDIDFFRSKEELIDKLRRYVQDDLLRQSIAEAGYRRVWADGHDVVSRMRQWLIWAEELRARS